MELPPLSRREILWWALLVEGGLAALAIALGLVVGINPLEGARCDAEALLLGLALATPMLLVFVLCVAFPVGPLRSIKRFAEREVKQMFGRCTVLDLAVISLLAGVGEELLMRGLAQTWLEELVGPTLALLLTSLAFGLLHPISATYVVLAALAGLWLGWAMQRTGNLTAVVIAHAVYDFAALTWIVKRGPRPRLVPPPTSEYS